MDDADQDRVGQNATPLRSEPGTDNEVRLCQVHQKKIKNSQAEETSDTGRFPLSLASSITTRGPGDDIPGGAFLAFYADRQPTSRCELGFHRTVRSLNPPSMTDSVRATLDPICGWTAYQRLGSRIMAGQPLNCQ